MYSFIILPIILVIIIFFAMVKTANDIKKEK
jgi:hypothetical protein